MKLSFFSASPLSGAWLFVVLSSSSRGVRGSETKEKVSEPPLFLRSNRRDLQEETTSSCSSCESGAAEYRFNPTATSFEAHEVIAEQQGCILASITSAEEQAAAVKAMEPFIGYDYPLTDDFQSSFAYIGGQVVPEGSDPEFGTYTFEWRDGSRFTTQRGPRQTSSQYTNWELSFSYRLGGWTSDPNGGTSNYPYRYEPYIALSLDENGSSGIDRGNWVDFSSRNSPALYKCCVPPPTTTVLTCDGMTTSLTYRFSPLELGWEEHKSKAEAMGCQLASIKSPEDQAAAEAAIAPYIGFEYQSNGFFHNAFIYIGAEMDTETSDPNTGDYLFEWADGSGSFEVKRRGTQTESTAYTNFIPGDPNGGTGIFADERYVALSLQERDSRGIMRGKWVDFSNLPSPALYQCCLPVPGSYAQCTVQEEEKTPSPVMAPNAPPDSFPGYLQNTFHCDRNYVSIADVGTALPLDLTGTIHLKTPFLFKGTDPIDILVVTTYGTINLDGQDAAAFGEIPISPEGSGYTQSARIQVAQSSRATPLAYYLETDEYIIISWEGILRFQAKLFFSTGRIDMLWPSGSNAPASVGIEDGEGSAWPAQGRHSLLGAYPFFFSDTGRMALWLESGDKCRSFEVARDEPTPSPTIEGQSPPETLTFEPFVIVLTTGDPVINGIIAFEPSDDGTSIQVTLTIDNPNGETISLSSPYIRCNDDPTAISPTVLALEFGNDGYTYTELRFQLVDTIFPHVLNDPEASQVCGSTLGELAQSLVNGNAYVNLYGPGLTFYGSGGIPMATFAPSPAPVQPTFAPVAPSPAPVSTSPVPSAMPTKLPTESPSASPNPTASSMPSPLQSESPSQEPTTPFIISQASKFYANDAAYNDLFGASVAIDGNMAIVGAIFDDENGSNSGSAYIFEEQGPDVGWQQVAKLTPNDGLPNDFFGESVGIDGKTAIVGTKNGGRAAYIFQDHGPEEGWQQVAALTPNDPAEAAAEFGRFVAISGTTVIVSAGRKMPYIFQEGPDGWQQVAQLIPEGGGRTVSSVDITEGGTKAIVGASSPYLFQEVGPGDWRDFATLTPIGVSSGFRNSVAFDGVTAIVGSPFDDNEKGAATIFRDNDGSGEWKQIAKLTAEDGVDKDQFGWSVAIQGNIAVVGAWLFGQGRFGAVYIFREEKGSGDWILVKKLLTDSDSGDFSNSVAMDGSRIIVGAPYEDDKGDDRNPIRASGSVYVFEID